MTNNKDFLSQEEIDALLNQTSKAAQVQDDPISIEVDEPLDVSDYISEIEQDALGEIGNITFGSAATALSTLLGKKVQITTPKLSAIAREELIREFPVPHVAIHVNYVDGFQGINLLVMKTTDAQVIANLMLGGEGTEPEETLNEIHLSAVQEAMNQMMGSSATSMSTIFNRFINISPPGIDILDLTSDKKNNLPDESIFVKVSFRLIIGDLIDSTIMQLLSISFARELVHTLMNLEQEVEEEVEIETSFTQQLDPSQSREKTPTDPEQIMQETGAPSVYYEAQENRVTRDVDQESVMETNKNVQAVQFASLEQSATSASEPSNLDLLLDIPLKVTVELGRTQKPIKDILELSQGSIIELDKLAGEPVDILVNEKLIAKGEVVVIDENFGVRVVDIVDRWDRLQKVR